jgi:hypothetical protein
MCWGRTQVHENVLLLRFVCVAVGIEIRIGLGFDSDTDPNPESFFDSSRASSKQVSTAAADPGIKHLLRWRLLHNHPWIY